MTVKEEGTGMGGGWVGQVIREMPYAKSVKRLTGCSPMQKTTKGAAKEAEVEAETEAEAVAATCTAK